MFSSHTQAGEGLSTSEEAYNFFTFNFEPDPQDGAELISRKRQKKKTVGEDRDEDVDEQEDAEVDEDNEDKNEDQVSKKKLYVLGLFPRFVATVLWNVADYFYVILFVPL